MDMIDTFEITGLTVEGFKCFADKQTFKFGAISNVTGHNGQGKSSVAEAISYAITGNPYYGSEQGIDRLYTINGKKNVSVELSIITGDGGAHKLTRSRENDVTTVTYDGVTIKQTDIFAMFGEKDVFLSIFNPLYFIEVLGDKGRNLLERYLPPVPHEAVLNQLSEHSRGLIEGRKMKSPESLLEEVRAEIRELEESVIYIEGQRDLLESQARDRRIEAKGKNDEISALNMTIETLEKKRSEGLNFDELSEKLEVANARYDELSRDSLTHLDTSDADAKIQETMAMLEKRRADEYVSSYAAQIAGMEATVTQLRDRYLREGSIMSGLSTGISCPMCKQGITEQNIESVKKSFELSLTEVLEKGRELSAQLTEMEALNAKTKAAFEQFRDDDVAKMETELDALRKLRVSIVSEAETAATVRKTEMESLKTQIQSLEVDIRFGNLMPDEGWTLESLITDREKLEAEVASLNEEKDDPIAEKTGDLESIKKSIRANRDLESAIKFYISARSDLMLGSFGSLNRIKIDLYEATKKGIVKDVFKFSFDGKPYKFLSLSEKMKAGLEVSELIKRLTGRNYPVFIDNGESIPVIDNVRPTGQIFIAQVVKGAPLEVSGAPEAQKAAA